MPKAKVDLERLEARLRVALTRPLTAEELEAARRKIAAREARAAKAPRDPVTWVWVKARSLLTRGA